MARKRFGQHFLVDPAVVERIVDALNPRRDDAVIEIGPGRGALTRVLADRLDRLEAIEIDRDLADSLHERVENRADMRLVAHNALAFDYAQHARALDKRLRLVGNLAYNIGTPLVFRALGTADWIQDMHFMLQKEVVDRVVAGPGEPAYGRLSVAVAVRADAARLFEVPPSVFRPPPAVTSAVVRIVPRDRPAPIADWAVFDRLVAEAFSHRRKTVGNALKSWFDRAQITALDVDPRRRPGELAPSAYTRLANAVSGRR